MMISHVYLRVEAKSPITIRSDHGQEGAATTHYIPGTTLLGGLAAVHRMLRPDKEQEFTSLFLNEAVYFSFLYPAVFKQRDFDGSNLPVIPLPKTAQSCKRFSGFKPVRNERTTEQRHGIRDSLLDWGTFSLLDQEQQAISTLLNQFKDHKTCEDEHCEQEMDHIAGFYRISRRNPAERMLAKVSTHLQTRTGINRSWGIVEEGILYNREVFDENMCFWGEIVLPDELTDTFKSFLKEAEEEDVVRIGTGRTRGLGHVTIRGFDGGREDIASFRKKLEDFNAAFQQRAQDAGVSAPAPFYFAITLRSLAILCDPYLRHYTSIDAETLARHLKPSTATYKKIYQAKGTQCITGWNGLWGTPRTNDQAVEMGSTFLFSCTHTLEDEELLQALYTLEETGIGQRLSEGFGRLSISDPFHLQGGQA